MKRWQALVIGFLLLAGCGSAGSTGANPPPPPAALNMEKPQPAYQAMQPLVEDKSHGFSFKRPTDWVRQIQEPDSDFYFFGSAQGVPAASFVIARYTADQATARWKLGGKPLDPAKLRDAWRAEQQQDVAHKWQEVGERAVSSAGLTGYRFELTGGSDKFRSDTVVYLLVGPDTVLTLTLLNEAPRATFNPQRWAGMIQALDDLVATMQPAPQ